MITEYFIVFSIIVSTLGYLISPDSTPYANNQILEIGTQKPGFRVEMLKVRKNSSYQETALFKKMLFGAEDNYSYVPIDSPIGFRDDNVLVRIFEPEGVNMEIIVDYIDLIIMHLPKNDTLGIAIIALSIVILVALSLRFASRREKMKELKRQRKMLTTRLEELTGAEK